MVDGLEPGTSTMLPGGAVVISGGSVNCVDDLLVVGAGDCDSEATASSAVIDDLSNPLVVAAAVADMLGGTSCLSNRICRPLMAVAHHDNIKYRPNLISSISALDLWRMDLAIEHCLAVFLRAFACTKSRRMSSVGIKLSEHAHATVLLANSC